MSTGSIYWNLPIDADLDHVYGSGLPTFCVSAVTEDDGLVSGWYEAIDEEEAKELFFDDKILDAEETFFLTITKF